MTRRGLPLAAIFTLGNQAAIDIAALLDILADDERITAIGLHIEGLRDPPPSPPPWSRPATTENR
jgi:acyl-CoA synthetase (NDP forming)